MISNVSVLFVFSVVFLFVFAPSAAWGSCKFGQEHRARAPKNGGISVGYRVSQKNEKVSSYFPAAAWAPRGDLFREIVFSANRVPACTSSPGKSEESAKPRARARAIFIFSRGAYMTYFFLSEHSRLIGT